MRDNKCTLNGELWKDIPSAPGYKASNLGRIIRTFDSRTNGSGGVLNPSMSKGYMVVTVYSPAGRKRRYVHQLVCEAWNGPSDGATECRHLDGSRSNNVPENLAWGSRKENAMDAVRHGSQPSGESHGRSVINWNDAIAIRKLRESGQPYAAIAKEFGIGISQVGRIARKENWWPVPEEARDGV